MNIIVKKLEISYGIFLYVKHSISLMLPIVVPNFTHLIFHPDGDWKDAREVGNTIGWMAKIDSKVEIGNGVSAETLITVKKGGKVLINRSTLIIES